MNNPALPIAETQPPTGQAGADCVQRFVGRHCRATLYLGDSETMDRIEADALLADPPYGINLNTDYSWTGRGRKVDGYGKGTGKKYPRVKGDSKPFEPAMWLNYPVVVLWGAQNYASKLPDGNGWLVWNKRGDGKPSALWFGDCEVAWTNIKGPIRMFSHMWHGVARWAKEDIIHPTQKPVALMAWVMETAKVPVGATVLDPYMGSGSTGIACIRTGRNFIGIEKDPQHYAAACDRIAHELDGTLL